MRIRFLKIETSITTHIINNGKISMKPRHNDHNISTQHILTLLGAIRHHMLRHVSVSMLCVVGSNVNLVKFPMQHLWMLHDVGKVHHSRPQTHRAVRHAQTRRALGSRMPGSCNNVAPEKTRKLLFLAPLHQTPPRRITSFFAARACDSKVSLLAGFKKYYPPHM